MEMVTGSAALKRRISAGLLAGLKARRPPQTMADIPFPVRRAAKEYIKQVDHMSSPRVMGLLGRSDEAWQEEDLKRQVLHDRFLSELRRIGLTWKGGGDSQDIAREITTRRWKAGKRRVAPALARWVEKAERLGWHRPKRAKLTRSMAVLYPELRVDPFTAYLVVWDSGAWEVRQGFDKYESGRGNIPTVSRARRMVSG